MAAGRRSKMAPSSRERASDDAAKASAEDYCRSSESLGAWCCGGVREGRCNPELPLLILAITKPARRALQPPKANVTNAGASPSRSRSRFAHRWGRSKVESDAESELDLLTRLRRHKGHFYRKRYPSLSQLQPVSLPADTTQGQANAI